MFPTPIRNEGFKPCKIAVLDHSWKWTFLPNKERPTLRQPPQNQAHANVKTFFLHWLTNHCFKTVVFEHGWPPHKGVWLNPQFHFLYFMNSSIANCILIWRWQIFQASVVSVMTVGLVQFSLDCMDGQFESLHRFVPTSNMCYPNSEPRREIVSHMFWSHFS